MVILFLLLDINKLHFKNLLSGYVTKEPFEDCVEYYRVFIIHLDYPNFEPVDLNVNNRRQTMIQFLYRKRKQPDNDRFLVFIHETCKFLILNYLILIIFFEKTFNQKNLNLTIERKLILLIFSYNTLSSGGN